MDAWSRNSLKNFGLARSTAVTMASDFGALFKGMGINMQQTEEWSRTLTERTMDLSNFYDTTVEETTRALNAIVTGQTEPLRRFGINMTQATLKEYARQKGIRKSIEEMTEAEKVQLRYNFVIERTNIAVGTTARESDSATGQINRFKESIKELGVGFSEHILPMIVPVIDKLNTMIEKFTQLSDGTKKFIVAMGGVVAAGGPIIWVLGKVFGSIKDINDGIGKIPDLIESVGKVGNKLKGLLDTTQFLGFAKWAGIIAGVSLAIAGVVTALNILFGKGDQMNQFVNNLGNMFKDVGGVISGASNQGRNISRRYIDGSHRAGLDYVPYDGYIAELHEGERVVTKEENKGGIGDTYILQVNMDEVDEVYKLVQVFENFKQTRRAGVV